MELEELYLRLESRMERDLKFLLVQKKDILTIDDASIILDLSTSQIYKLTMMRKIKFYNLMVRKFILNDPMLMSGFSKSQKPTMLKIEALLKNLGDWLNYTRNYLNINIFTILTVSNSSSHFVRNLA